MNATEIEKIVCYHCHAVLDLGDNYCRHCGAPTSRPSTLGNGPGVPIVPRPRVGESRLVILVMLFAVLGPLALPMLWRSRSFSPAWKLILTVLVLGATLALFWLAWYTVHTVVAPLHEALYPKGGF